MGVMKLLYTLRGEGTSSLGLATACRHNALCVMDLVRFDAAGRPGYEPLAGAYWPALLAWLRTQEATESEAEDYEPIPS